MTFDWLHNIYKIEDESLPNADAVIALQKLQMHSHIVHTNTHTVHTHKHTYNILTHTQLLLSAAGFSCVCC